MRVLLGWIGIAAMVFILAVLLGDDCRLARKTRARLERTIDSDIAAKADGGVR